ncbi:flagellar assembly protein FliX [Parvibaculum sp.]|uniref:flagellar assembly protein FliX n=1 Tax=Parvibaculum sp. TaxID=2024848 RepID=UPI003299F570
MKIGQTRSASQSGTARATRASSGGSGFAPSSASGARGTAGLSGLASLGAVDALLALQETPVSDDALHSPRRKAIRRGEEMLDILDDIKLSLLMGQLPKSKLSRLLAVVERQGSSFNDPRLGQVLAEIELRAKVELAKFGTYTNG